jgi:7-cyano-7-deazaguanine reductase
MALQELDNSNVDTHLGKTSPYTGEYDKSFLVKEPRSSNRTYLNIEEETLPFEGCDIWNGYEISGLTNNGKPVAAIAKIIYPCNSKYIVESKSMKLYWNSFNMTKWGDSDIETMDNMAKRAIEDLSELLETGVSVQLYYPDERAQELVINEGEYIHLELAANEDLTFDTYNESPELLEFEETIGEGNELKQYKSNLLKSNCRVTSQPDWGDIFIGIRGNKQPTVDSLLKYIVSFRDECHFHEEICECIYKRLWDLCSPDELSVTCLYVRRGGWDINPHRISHSYLYNNQLADVGVLFNKQPRQ